MVLVVIIVPIVYYTTRTFLSSTQSTISRRCAMVMKTLVYGVALTIFICGYFHVGLAAEVNKGPKDMVLQATKDKASKPKPATFPHALHQAAASCAECHHTLKDGKKSPYVEGMAIKKCEECHYTGSAMPSEDDPAKSIVKLDTFKDAAHARCRSCHDKIKKDKPELKEKWKGCTPCHE
jgi:hypothetical protein